MAAADVVSRQTRIGLIWPLSQGARAGGVAQRISRAILLGLLADGEQLPAEAEFAAQLGVSPMTLREALSVLREQGLVETRRGRTGGTFVRRRTDLPFDQLRTRLAALTVTQLRELADAQIAVDGTAALLAAERAPQMTVRRLFTLVDQLEAASMPGDLIRADSRFHIEVAIASQSERLLRLAVDLQTETADLLTIPHEPNYDWAGAVQDHRAIAEAVAQGAATRARLAAEQHIHRNLAHLIDLHSVTPAGAAPPIPNGVGPSGDQSPDDLPSQYVAGLTEQVRRCVETFFAAVTDLAHRFFDALDKCARAEEPLDPTALAGLHAVIKRHLKAQQPMADGMGVVLEPGVVPEHERYVEWLHHLGDRIAPINLNLDLASVDVYDYVHMDWYTAPKRTGNRCVYGPFLDFSGVDQPVTMVTVPLNRDGVFYGVAGMDVRMSALERELMAILQRAPQDVVLVNAERNVLAANTPRWLLGSRVPQLPVVGDEFSTVEPVGADTGWVLACAEPSAR